MRGGYIHNRVLLDPIAEMASRFGARVDREVSIRVDDRVLYGDLLVEGGSRRILVEAELSAKRLLSDMAKAVLLGVTELWLVVPNPRVAGSVRRKLLRQSIVPGRSGLFVLLLPEALQRLEEFSQLNSGSKVDSGKESEKKNKQRRLAQGCRSVAGGCSVRISNGAA